jgi:hypothetical protein
MAKLAEKQRQAARKRFDLLPSTTIYGKVVDQQGNPIPDADVFISWENATWLIGKSDAVRKDWVKTDANGQFTFVCAKPFRAYAGAQKDGYEQVAPVYATRDLIRDQITSKENPAVILLRKRGELSFLLSRSTGARGRWFWVKATNSVTSTFDILAPIGEKPPPNVWYSDLKLDGVLDATGGCWTATLSATNGTDCLFLSDEILYEAPTNGYVRQVELPAIVVGVQEQRKYIYLKSRTPAIYSRIMIESKAWNDKHTGQNLRFWHDEWINPYGSRTFEYDGKPASVPTLTRILTEEAKAAIRAGKHPEYPDIPRRVKEQEEKEAAEKEKYAEFRRLTREANERRQKEGEERKKREAENK